MSESISSQALDSKHKLVIFASSLGTVFEWYDFYIYGTLAGFFGRFCSSAWERKPLEIGLLKIDYPLVPGPKEGIPNRPGAPAAFFAGCPFTCRAGGVLKVKGDPLLLSP